MFSEFYREKEKNVRLTGKVNWKKGIKPENPRDCINTFLFPRLNILSYLMALTQFTIFSISDNPSSRSSLPLEGCFSFSNSSTGSHKKAARFFLGLFLPKACAGDKGACVEGIYNSNSLFFCSYLQLWLPDRQRTFAVEFHHCHPQ